MEYSEECYICDRKPQLFNSNYTLVVTGKSGFFKNNYTWHKICTDCQRYLSDKYQESLPNHIEDIIDEKKFEYINSIKDEISKEIHKTNPCKHCSFENNKYSKRICKECDYEFCFECFIGIENWIDQPGGCPSCNKKTYWDPIINLLKDKSKQMSISDIAALIDKDRDKVKVILKFMYKEKMINFGGNGRYFILSDKKKAAKATSKKSDTTDVKAELKKYKQMLDEELIEQADFDAKKKELLGL